MQEMESEGKTVAEAVESALKKMGLRRNQVEVEILREAKSGFMGIGARSARVKISEKKWTGGAAAQGQSEQKAAVTPRPGRKENGHRPVHRENRRSSPAPVQEARRRTPESRPAAKAVKPEDRPTKADSAAGRKQEPSAPPTPEEIAAASEKISSLLSEILGLMHFTGAKVGVSWEAQQERLMAAIESPEANRLIEDEGRALDALQLMTNLILSCHEGRGHLPVQLDALGYRSQREQDIFARADRAATQAKNTGKPQRLEPMDAATRRLVHKHLFANPDIMTVSEGEGPWRKIVVRPRKN